MNTSKYPWIRRVYLYLFTFIGLVLITIGCVRMVSLALKTYVFKQADIYYSYPMAKPVPALETGTRSTSSGQASTEPTKEEIAEFEEKQKTSNRQREAAESIAFILVGVPLYFYHWRVIQKEKESSI